MTEKVAYGLELRNHKAGLWRGVIDEVENRNSPLGPIVTGQRVWRCAHEHRSQGLAQTCAHRELRRSADPSPEFYPDCQKWTHDPLDCRGDGPEDHDPRYSTDESSARTNGEGER